MKSVWVLEENDGKMTRIVAIFDDELKALKTMISMAGIEDKYTIEIKDVSYKLVDEDGYVMTVYKLELNEILLGVK